MIEILIIYSACKNLSAAARECGRSGVPFGIAFVFLYLGALVLGAVVGQGIYGMNPIVGGYMLAIPGAFAAYYSLRAIIRRDVPQPRSEGNVVPPPLPPRPPAPPVAPPLLPFTFSCAHCGQHISATPDKVGTEGECPACALTVIVPAPSA